jgi:hypothetical protein
MLVISYLDKDWFSSRTQAQVLDENQSLFIKIWNDQHSVFINIKMYGVERLD